MRLKLKKNTHYILCDGCNLNDWFRADNSNFIGSDQGSFNGMISGVDRKYSKEIII